MKEVTFIVKGIHCSGCKNNVEDLVKKANGIKEADVNLMANTIKIKFDENKINENDICNLFKNSQYKLEPYFDEDNLFEVKSNKIELIKIIIGFILIIPLLFFGMGGMYESIMPDIIKESPFILSNSIQYILSISIIILFFKYYKNGFLSIIKLSFNMDSLVFLGSFFSFIYSIYLTIMAFFNTYSYSHYHLYLDSSAMILVIVSLGKYIEEISKNKAKFTIKELLNLRPKLVHKLIDNEIKDISIKEVKLNDLLVVKIGEKVPLDGLIYSGKTSIDESIITGESLPIFKKEDDIVIGGSINKEAPITILINKDKKDNVLNKIVNLVNEASNMKTSLTKKVDKVSKVFVPVVFIISLITFFTWLILGYINNGVLITSTHFHFLNIFDEAFTFGVGVLVISCPCALGLATPISLLVGSSVFSKNYILVQKSEGIEKIKDINTLVLDKTNTITEGELSVNEVNLLTNDKSILNKIYTLEKYNEHPIAKAICNYLETKEICLDSSFLLNETLPGSGIKSSFNDLDFEIYVTNYEYSKDIINLDKDLINDITNSSLKGELVILAYNSKKEVYAIFKLKDKLKKETKEFIENAYKYFKRIILLTGDNKTIANYIAKEANIKETISEVKPDEKDRIIKELIENNNKVMMVGDGVNDSIALTRATIGVSIAKGTDIAIASSHFILMRNNLNDIFNIFIISKKIRKNINFNLFWAFIYNIIFIPIAAGIFSYFGIILKPMYCSILMALSSVTVCLNALTLFIKSKSINK